MDSIEQSIYTQRDDRCVPPSPVDGYGSKVNSINETETTNSAVKHIKLSNGMDSVGIENSMSGKNLIDRQENEHKSNDFKLTVENLEKIKRERESISDKSKDNTNDIGNISFKSSAKSCSSDVKIKHENSVQNSDTLFSSVENKPMNNESLRNAADNVLHMKPKAMEINKLSHTQEKHAFQKDKSAIRDVHGTQGNKKEDETIARKEYRYAQLLHLIIQNRLVIGAQPNHSYIKPFEHKHNQSIF